MQVIRITTESTANNVIRENVKGAKRQITAINRPPPKSNFPPNKWVFFQFSSLFKVQGKRIPAK
jgi:hypothetical protein